jgi:hypothetical protein
METQLKTFKVVQIIPSFTYVTYHVQAENSEDAEFMVDNLDESAVEISEYTQDNISERLQYEVSEIDSDDF